MSRRTSRSTSYTSGVNPVGPFRAKVVNVSGGLASIQIPRLGMNNVYDDIPYSGFVPSVGASVWAFFIEGEPSRPMIIVGAGESAADITEIVAGVNLNGGGTGGSIQLSLDDSITLTSVTADNFYGSLTGDVTGNADTATTATNLSGGIGSIADGTALAPSLAFTSDSDTGIYRAGTNQLGFSAGNATRFQISPTLVEVIGVPFKADLIGPQTNNYLGIGAGETVAHMDGNLSGENLFLGAEGNINLVTTPDNWATGWAGRDETHLAPQSAGELRVTSDYGYIDLGPQNVTWCHIYTDRPTFYMNKPLNMGAGSTVRGALTVDGTLDVTGGVTGNVTGDVTGNLTGGSVAATTLTASGDANFDSGTLFVDVSTNRVGINTSSPTQTLDVNGILNVSGDIRYNNNAIVASYGSSTNIDHIWHDETNNAWNFVSDSTYKAAGNSALNAATLNGTTVNATTVNLNTSVHLTNVDDDGSMRVQGNTGYIEIGPKNDSACHIYTDLPGFYMDKYLNMNGGSTVRGALTVDGTLNAGSTLTASGTLNAGSATILGNLTVYGTTDLTDGTLTNVLRLHVNEIYADVGGSGDPSYTFGSPNDNTGMYLKTTGQLGFSLSGSEQMYLTSNGLHMASGDWFRSNGSSGWYNDTHFVGLYATQTLWVKTYGTGNVGLWTESTVLLASPLNQTNTSGSVDIRRDSTYGTIVTISSTRELKENVQSIDPAESGRIIDMLRPVTYIEKYRSGPDGSFVEGIPDTTNETAEQYKLREWDIEYGFIAEEIDALEPEGVKLASYDWQQIDEEGFPKPNGWKGTNVTAILVAEVKELRKRLAALEQVQ